MTTPLASSSAPGWLWEGRRLCWTTELGQGASARVWEARDESGRTYAVKVGSTPHEALRLLAEAKCLTVAHVKSLTVVLGGGRLPGGAPWAEAETDLPYLVLERASGRPLDEHWLCGVEGRGELLAAEVLADLCEALEELHAVGVAHGDLKPANILLRQEESGEVGATLVDLGLHAEVGSREVEGGSPRYLAPEIWSPELGAGDGRARDVYALALTLAELLVPELRESPDLRRAVAEISLPGPFEHLLRPLLAERPALRPSIRWLLSRLRACFGESPESARDRRLRVVRREYLRVRQQELAQASTAQNVEIHVQGDPRLWLFESLSVWRACRALDALPRRQESWEIFDLERYPQRRWLVGVLGPTAAAWPWDARTDATLAEKLLVLAARGPLEATTQAELAGSSDGASPTDVPQDPVSLALKLAELPVDPRVLERIEALRDLPSELGVAAARAWRLRGEPARARLLLSRIDDPAARLEAAQAARRLGAFELVNQELAALEGQPRGVLSLRSAQVARQALDEGRPQEARELTYGHQLTSALLETRALSELALGDVEAARRSVADAFSLATNEEQLARLEGVSGMLAHAEARPTEALEAFQRAARHAARAGALLEEATYLTGMAAAATDRGQLRLALSAAERATLLFESLERKSEAARAALSRTAAYALIGAEVELVAAGEEALWRARASGDRICEGYVHLAFCDGLGAQSSRARDHARKAESCLASSESAEPRLRVAARLLIHGLEVDIAFYDRLAVSVPSIEARLEWWGARAAQASAGQPSGTAEGILEELLVLANRDDGSVIRGLAFARGARLALLLSRSEDARRLLASARQAARELLAGTPDEYQRQVEALEWIALAETPEGSHFAPEQLAEVEALVRRLGTRERLRPLLEQVLDALLLWTGVERGLLLLRAPAPSGVADGERLVVRAARNLARQDLEGAQLELSQSLARRALERGAPVVAVDAAGELPDVHQSVHVLKLRSVLAVPLIARGETQGVVYLDDRVRRGAFGPRELAWVKLVATLAAVAIADARDQLRLRRAARKAKRAEARMAESLAQREVELELAERELHQTRRLRGDYSTIVGRSEAMRELLQIVDRVAVSEVPVLIQGESGSGKELVARALHDNGPRRGRAFVAENCAAIPEPLLESTLFGHVRGAFTGAGRTRAGLFEIASQGTLFLDEIAEMPLAMQTKLLRVLQEGEIRPVGSERARRVDVRVIAATHRDLASRVASGLFREDLFYRLNVIVLRVPSLRERAGDVLLLMKHFAATHGPGQRFELDASALEALHRFEWPGNVRQLENEVRRLLVLTEGVVRLEQLSPEIRAAVRLPARPDTLHVRTRVDALERELVEAALKKTEGNQTRAAELLGLSRFGLQKMMKRLDVEVPAGGSGRSGRAPVRQSSP